MGFKVYGFDYKIKLFPPFPFAHKIETKANNFCLIQCSYELWLAVWMHIIFTALVLGLVGLEQSRFRISRFAAMRGSCVWGGRRSIVGQSASDRGQGRCEADLPPPRSYQTTQPAHRGSFCFDFNPVHKMTTLRRRLWQTASGMPTLPIQWMTSWRFWWRTEVSAKVFHNFEDEMVSVDKDDEAVNVYYMKNQIDESQKLALCQCCS